jgi:3',5'-cyclic AMP phosphodiesterase CpdA
MSLNSFLFLSRLVSVYGAIEFVAYGDWGQKGDELVQTVQSVASSVPNRDFVILLGDNFYPQGVQTVDSLDFEMFTDIVAAGVTYPHYVILGNHDHAGNIGAQMLFSDRDSRWVMPSKNYKQTISKDGVDLCLLMIDTITFDAAQASWLSSQLSLPDCDPASKWVIVNGHYPIWSAGLYGDTKNLKAMLLPILHQHGVQLYLCGHEHLHEVFHEGKLVQVVSGATAAPRPARTFKDHPNQIWGLSGLAVLGFIHITATTEMLDVRIISTFSQKEFLRFSITHDATKESMFSHVKWNRNNSNADAWKSSSVSRGDSGTSWKGMSSRRWLGAIVFIAACPCLI